MIQNFIGKDGFIWWVGVIESRDDPLNLGRCQVRIFGWHTSNKQLIPTESLPWALPMNSPNSSMTAAAPVVGDFAFGFFSDGLSGQAPFMIGVFPGIPVNGPNDSLGFSEGSFYPVGEPTTSRLYRNENIDDTAIGYHNSNLDKDVPLADGNSWSEPESQYATQPPYNKVTETLAGHVFELDDTPDAERIHLNHKKDGLTFFEIAPDGSKVTKVQGTNYAIYLSDNNIHIKGQCNITVDGNATLYVKGDVTQKVDGNVTETVGGNVDSTVDGNVTSLIKGNLTSTVNQNADITIEGNLTQTVQGDASITVDGNLSATVGGDLSASVGGDMSASVSGSVSQSVGGSVSQSVGGSYSINAGGSFTVNASVISLN